MRRDDRRVDDINEICSILDRCGVCHVAMTDGAMPYVVPLSYGYEVEGDGLTLYFHSAKQGRKLDMIRQNSNVCFEISCEDKRIIAENPCSSGCLFSSVIGFGRAEIIDEPQEKCRALSIMYKRQSGENVDFSAEQADAVCMFKIVSDDFCGKRRV